DGEPTLGQQLADLPVLASHPHVGLLTAVRAVGHSAQLITPIGRDVQALLPVPPNCVCHPLLVAEVRLPGQHERHLQVRSLDAADPLELVVRFPLAEHIPDWHVRRCRWVAYAASASPAK